MNSPLFQFVNCRILRQHRIIEEDIWVRNGKIVNPEKIFFDEKIESTQKIDCFGNIIAPGLIDIQINGGFGHDFSYNTENIENGLDLVSKNLLTHGVTAYCPTVVTSPAEIYHNVLRKIKKRPGGRHGATILGIHIEGPFISLDKKGAHPPDYIRQFDQGFQTVEEVYGHLDNVKIVTLAPELANSAEVIRRFRARDIVVSLGHSIADLAISEQAVINGATLITHLFNAMLPFHHRDPGLVGLLASSNIPKDTTVYFGIIADGVHTHPAALRIAYRVHPEGLVLVTDAISALGLHDGKHNIGQFVVEIRKGCAYVAGTDTLCGSIASMISSVKLFHKATGCSLEYALEAASLHPAKVLGISHIKGTLDYGADADFIMLNDKLDLVSTWIAGECVYVK